jgi:hypothetical protein
MATRPSDTELTGDMEETDVDDFFMQASNPRSLRSFDEDDRSIMDALQTVFPLYAEDAYMAWGPIRGIPFNYKYTISHVLPDVLKILDRLMQDESGTLSNSFITQEFPAIWHLRWEDDKLEIRSEWNIPPGTSAPFPEHPPLVLGKRAFISEWKQVLGAALRALTDAGYTEAHLSDLAKLRQVYEDIHEPGVLYRSQG